MITETISFALYEQILEAFDGIEEPYERDQMLETLGDMTYPTKDNSMRAFYTDKMNENGLRVMHFINNDGEAEYHLHGNPESSNTEGFLSAVNLIYNHAKHKVAAGIPVKLQTMDKRQHKIYGMIARRLSDRHGATVSDLGLKPLTTYPLLNGYVTLVK